MIDFLVDSLFSSLPTWLQYVLATIFAALLIGLLAYLWSEGRLVS